MEYTPYASKRVEWGIKGEEMLEEKILELKREITGFAGIVEKMVDKSIKGLVNKDKDILDEVIRIDEPKVNNLEIEIDELCTTLIAQYAPKGKDLRIILMAMKMNNDLERIGDHAVNITQSSLSLIESPFVKPLNDIPKMSEAAVNMFKDSINAFVNEDPALAKGVCERDNTVDDLRTKIMKELTLYMGKDPSTIERSLNLIRITGNLERIADLSTNICEDVIYLAEGRVIKHNKV